MPRGKQSRGKCEFCGQEVAKNGVSKHLAVCTKWKESEAKADLKKGGKAALYHLRIQAAGLPQFWLDLEMRGTATLQDLDRYLRSIWLECCGHMSQFSFGGRKGDEIPMNRRIQNVLATGAVLTHIYDFGTSSETLVKAVEVREGKSLTRHPITLLVRNIMPEPECIECGKPASWLCMECIMEEDVAGTLCDEHRENHPHEEYGDPVPLVNSPRMGICGYDGPAEPPY